MPPGCTVAPGDIPSFSCILATDDLVRTLYFSWLTAFLGMTVARLWLMHLVPLFEIPGDGRPKAWDHRFCHRLCGPKCFECCCSLRCEKRFYDATTIIYTILSVLEIVWLFLVGVFFVTDPALEDAHYLFAGFAFGSHVVRSTLLCARRWMAEYDWDWRFGNGTPNWPLLLLNSLWCLSQLILLIVLSVWFSGWLEFWLMMALQIGAAWLFVDYRRDVIWIKVTQSGEDGVKKRLLRPPEETSTAKILLPKLSADKNQRGVVPTVPGG